MLESFQAYCSNDRRKKNLLHDGYLFEFVTPRPLVNFFGVFSHRKFQILTAGRKRNLGTKVVLSTKAPQFQIHYHYEIFDNKNSVYLKILPNLPKTDNDQTAQITREWRRSCVGTETNNVQSSHSFRLFSPQDRLRLGSNFSQFGKKMKSIATLVNI